MSSFVFEDTPLPRLKLLVLGDARSGKSALVQYVIDGTFIDAGENGERDEFDLTGHVPVSLKTKNFFLRNSHVILQLWEIAADADDTTMKVYYQNARGVFLVVDLTQGENGPESALRSAVSVRAVPEFAPGSCGSHIVTIVQVQWKKEVLKRTGLPISGETPKPGGEPSVPAHRPSNMPVFILVLNKCDEPSVNSAISHLALDEFCREHDIAAWFGASAKDGDNVDIALEAMVAEVVQDDDVTQRQVSCEIDTSALSCPIS